ncbi:MAG TPA: protein-disulfide reductase DsbD domain-containing protein, partial [Moraxellaceae bacterium]|nr:protein-disulfide reductase DsbD domain-containing protein [Moraxellaceae bacterium]
MNLHPPVRSLSLWALLLLAVTLAFPAMAPAAGLRKIGGSAPDFLRADEAFQLVPSRTVTGVSLAFEITPGYYLYRDRFHFTADGPGVTVGEAGFPVAGEWKDDPSFGRVKVFHESLSVALPLKGEGRLRVRWQGCADAGLCYPPQEQVLLVDAKGVTAAVEGPSRPGITSTRPATTESAATPSTPPPSGKAGEAASLSAAHAVYGLPGIPTNATQWLVFFLMGLGLSLTPCVLPMLPILAGIVARQHTSSALR